MRVIHIIPSAFNYFDDIREQAMSLVQKERESGVDAEAYTLQYGSVSSAQKGEARGSAPSICFIGLNSSAALVNDLDNYDLVHLHAPFLGMAGNILKWKKTNPKKPMVVTYWRDIRMIDAMSVFMALYNRVYLPDFFSFADTLIFHGNGDDITTKSGRRMAKNTKYYFLKDITEGKKDGDNIHLTITSDKLKLSEVDMEARACISVYNKLIK